MLTLRMAAPRRIIVVVVFRWRHNFVEFFSFLKSFWMKFTLYMCVCNACTVVVENTLVSILFWQIFEGVCFRSSAGGAICGPTSRQSRRRRRVLARTRGAEWIAKRVGQLQLRLRGWPGSGGRPGRRWLPGRRRPPLDPGSCRRCRCTALRLPASPF